MRANVEAALAFVFKDEGGYAERPEEGGGAVNMGITFSVFKAWRLTKGYPEPTWADLKAMTKEEATQIYIVQYLNAVHFDDLPAGVDYAVYDASITGGVTGSTKILQEALGLKPVDGHYGLVTRWAANHRPVPDLINKICDIRLAKYKTFKIYNKIANPDKPKEKQKTWGQIWTARIEEVRKRSMSMITAANFTAPPPPVTTTHTVPLDPKVQVTPTLEAIPIPRANYKSFPPPIIKMPASNELSRQMLKRGGTPEQFLNYLKDEARQRMGAWRPRGIVLHNTGHSKGQWPGVVNGKTILPEQRLDNMTVDWVKRKFPSAPHLLIVPDGTIWLLWPLWRTGTHSPSWNNTDWGIETWGDWNKETPTPELVRATEIACAGMLAMIGHDATMTTIKFHKEDPKTSHKACPGPKFGTKASWVKAIDAQMRALNPNS